MKIDYNEAINKVRLYLTDAFRPLSMLPKSNVTGNFRARFDADWLMSLVTKVHCVTGYTPDIIMNQLSMNACCYYFIQWYRMNSAIQNIYKRSSEQLLTAIDYRCCQLITDRLVQLNVIKQLQKQKIIQIMTTDPNNK